MEDSRHPRTNMKMMHAVTAITGVCWPVSARARAAGVPGRPAPTPSSTPAVRRSTAPSPESSSSGRSCTDREPPSGRPGRLEYAQCPLGGGVFPFGVIGASRLSFIVDSSWAGSGI